MSTQPRANALSRLGGVERWLREVRPVYLLAPLALVQIGIALAFALSVKHNGWLWYSGGDATGYWAEQWSVAHGLLPHTFLSYALPVAYAWVPLLWGPTLLTGLPVIIVLQLVVGIPLILVGFWAVADRFAGRVFAWWATLVWIVGPLLFVRGLKSDYRSQFDAYFLVPHWFGFTDMADFWSLAAVLWSAWAIFRALDTGRLEHAALAGLLLGVLIGLKPANSVFLAGGLLGFIVLRRGRQLGIAALAAAPALITLTLWKYRGTGLIPVLSIGSHPVREAAGPNMVAVSLSNHYVHFDWGQAADKLSQIGDVVWSLPLLEFIAIAGAFALVRKSPLKGASIVLWFVAYFIVKGNSPLANVPQMSFWRLTVPGMPAFILMAAALPFLVPGLGARLRRAPAPTPDGFLWTRGLVVAAVALAVVPLAVVAIASPMSSSQVARNHDNTESPVSPAFHLAARTAASRVHLSWRRQPTGRTKALFAIYRSPAATDACAVQTPGARECWFTTVMTTVATTSGLAADDRPGPGRWLYRVSLVANPDAAATGGDMVLLSPPVEVTTG